MNKQMRFLVEHAQTEHLLFRFGYPVNNYNENQHQQTCHNDEGGRGELHESIHEAADEHNEGERAAQCGDVAGSAGLFELDTHGGGQRDECGDAAANAQKQFLSFGLAKGIQGIADQCADS